LKISSSVTAKNYSKSLINWKVTYNYTGDSELIQQYRSSPFTWDEDWEWQLLLHSINLDLKLREWKVFKITIMTSNKETKIMTVRLKLWLARKETIT